MFNPKLTCPLLNRPCIKDNCAWFRKGALNYDKCILWAIEDYVGLIEDNTHKFED